MGKLHELLAVETDLANKARSVMSETVKRFGDIANYVGQRRNYAPLVDDGQPFPPEDKELPRTVNDDLNQVFYSFGRWVDASIQKEVTNQDTLANVEVDDVVILADLPATALLNLESKLADLGKVLKAIPVNDLAYRWAWDEDVGGYVSSPRVTFRTEKAMKTHVQYEATKEHPAQVQTYAEDNRVGEWTTVIHSGAVSASDKRGLIERWETLILAIKIARQRANDIEASTANVSDKIIKYLRG